MYKSFISKKYLIPSVILCHHFMNRKPNFSRSVDCKLADTVRQTRFYSITLNVLTLILMLRSLETRILEFSNHGLRMYKQLEFSSNVL